MFDPTGLNLGLGSLPLLSNAKTRSISAENPTGAKGGSAQALPDKANAGRELGKGWKVRPCISLEPGSKTTLADIQGPGVIQHIWITVDPKSWSDIVLRIYWDDETTPSVESPLGEFFASGHRIRTKIFSIPVAVNPAGGFNCYWPMPFRKRARIEVQFDGHEPQGGFFYQINYALTEVPAAAAYFHAQYRRSLTRRDYPEHVLLEGVKGQGHYVGTYIAWTQMSNGWWGEGEIKFYMDGDDLGSPGTLQNRGAPTICGTGTEDYFGGAWCFGDTYTGPFLGYPLHDKPNGGVPKHGLYRWHVLDPIRFEKDLKVTIQALGWWPGGVYEPLTDDLASVAYWYQTEPHAPFPLLPDRRGRHSR
ncbi:MAG: DUF2961 domain-containing protein [Phycisphaeraceae bacterium]|nr:DUF2961 domain-containing protein [Phycisphaeraceae bacterium]